ncbi:MAG: polyprenyl synthetase family protein, partial [Myxococcota bacterium]
MASPRLRALPGGAAARTQPAGVLAGAPLSRIDGPADALALVGTEMAAAEAALRDLVVSDVRAVPAVATYLVDAGGKRLRPALTALGARAVQWSSPNLPQLMCVGELIHLGSLLHDDVVDDAASRRNRDATHKVYGNAVTILTGDFCLARAVLLASEAGGHRAVTELARAVTAMAEGEVLQLQRSGDLSATLDEYLELIDKKSAALISWCAAAGALAKGDDRAADILGRYGRNVGVAFQVTDDVLDYQGGTGKTPGADLRERKVTLPLLFAAERDPGIVERLLDHAPTDAELPDLIERVRATGALDRALSWARGRVDGALNDLGGLPDA